MYILGRVIASRFNHTHTWASSERRSFLRSRRAVPSLAMRRQCVRTHEPTAPAKKMRSARATKACSFEESPPADPPSFSAATLVVRSMICPTRRGKAIFVALETNMARTPAVMKPFSGGTVSRQSRFSACLSEAESLGFFFVLPLLGSASASASVAGAVAAPFEEEEAAAEGSSSGWASSSTAAAFERPLLLLVGLEAAVLPPAIFTSCGSSCSIHAYVFERRSEGFAWRILPTHHIRGQRSQSANENGPATLATRRPPPLRLLLASPP